MSIKFTWREELSVGNKEIDNQHKYLFQIGREIIDAQLDEKREFVLKLYRYTRDHFKSEEEHMRNLEYPLYDEHKSLHTNLITKLNGVVEIGLRDKESCDEFETFVYKWITHHIMKEDMKFKDFENYTF